MILGIVLAIAVLVLALLIYGLSRINLPRKPSFEGIEDYESAQAYHRISRWPQFRLLRRMIARKLAKFQPAGTLADIGCGPGRLTTLIARRHRHLRLLGLDAAEEMIRAATLNASSLGLSDRVQFRQGDVHSLPLPADTLDFAVSTLSLHHWSDPGRGLAEIHRVLKTGGQLFLFDLRRDPRCFFYWLLRFGQAVVVPGELRRINEPLGSLLSSYTLAELHALLARSPFKEFRIEGRAGWVFAWAGKGRSGASRQIAEDR